MIVPDNEHSQLQAAQIIQRGGVIAFRTDTFYGLGADPLNAESVRKIKALKGTDAKPILLLISDPSQVERFIVKPSEAFNVFARRFWPGPLTLIGAARSELSFDLTAGTNTIGLRLPDDENVRALVRACGGALTATSANVSGSAPSRSASEVENSFSSGIELIIDGGEVTATEPSSVVDLSGPEPQLIREGAVKREILAHLLGRLR